MSEQEDLYVVLNRLRDKSPLRQALSIGKIAQLTEIPKRTLVNWFQEGHIAKPRDWRGLIKVAVVLMFDHAEVEQLLTAARQPSLDKLRRLAESEEDKKLLAPWPPLEPPFQAENTLPYFTDREAVLAEIVEALTLDQPPPLVSIEGMPGVGKTELAAVIAHQMRPHFRDGILWVDAPSSDPMATLRELAAEMRHDLSSYKQLPGRSRAFKTILGKNQVLIILDGVTSDKQVDPFVPQTGSPSSLVVTTQRQDLWTTRIAHSVYIEEFTDADATQLFINVLGHTRFAADRQALQALAGYAGNLPIAIDVTAHSLRGASGRTASDFLHTVEESEEQLLQLKLGSEANIISLFEASYKQLPPSRQRFFATLGVFAGPDFSVEAAAFVNEMPPAQTRDMLRELAATSLLKETTKDRYRLHTLLREFANSKLSSPRIEERMIQFYTEHARQRWHDPPLIAREAGNIRAALELARQQEKNRPLVDGTIGIYKYLEAGGLFDEAIVRLDQALAAARTLPDRAAEARIIVFQADIERTIGDLDKVEAILETAIEPTEASGDAEVQSIFWQAMGTLRAYRRDMAGAEAGFQRALHLAREGGYELGICHQLSNLCAARLYQGKVEGTAEMLREGLALSRAIEARLIESSILANLASLEDALGNDAAANNYLSQSLDVARLDGHRSTIINISAHLAATEVNLRDYGGAAAHLLEALIQARELGDTLALSRVLRNYGELYSATGNPTAADHHFAEALQLARAAKNELMELTILTDWGERLVERKDYPQARSRFDEMTTATNKEDFPQFWGIALLGRAEMSAATGDNEEAYQYAQEALALFERISDPRVGKTTALMARLASADASSD